MNGKQTALMAVVGMALLATVMTVSSPAPALALSHLNLDGNFTPNSDIADDRIDSSGTTDNTEEVGAEEEYDADDEDSDTATTDGNDNSNAEEDSSHIAYEELLGCLLNVEAETEQKCKIVLSQVMKEWSVVKMLTIQKTKTKTKTKTKKIRRKTKISEE